MNSAFTKTLYKLVCPFVRCIKGTTYQHFRKSSQVTIKLILLDVSICSNIKNQQMGKITISVIKLLKYCKIHSSYIPLAEQILLTIQSKRLDGSNIKR